MYSPQVLDHFHHPRGAGTMADADASARRENPVCGDRLEFMLRIEGGRIAAIRFQVQGCVPAVACASTVVELTQGRTMSQARQLDRGKLLASLGGLPPAAMHAVQLALETLRAALDQIPDQS